MAEEHVSKEQFGEFVKRMDERFDHMNELADQRYDSINQRLADAEKAREQNLVHVNQRFDNLQGSISDLRADMRQMRNWLVWLFGLVVFGFIGSIVLILFRDVFK
jgi:C4-dicarboxylate-specific signal transduction histidine kinase